MTRSEIIERSYKYGHHVVPHERVYVFCPQCRTRVEAPWQTAMYRSRGPQITAIRAAMREHLDECHSLNT